MGLLSGALSWDMGPFMGFWGVKSAYFRLISQLLGWNCQKISQFDPGVQFWALPIFYFDHFCILCRSQVQSFKSWQCPKNATISNAHDTPPRGPRAKKICISKFLSRGYLRAKNDQTQWDKGVKLHLPWNSPLGSFSIRKFTCFNCVFLTTV